MLTAQGLNQGNVQANCGRNMEITVATHHQTYY